MDVSCGDAADSVWRRVTRGGDNLSGGREEDDNGIQMISMLRTTENKSSRQGIADPSELTEGFPSKAEDLLKSQRSSSALLRQATFRRSSESCCGSLWTARRRNSFLARGFR